MVVGAITGTEIGIRILTMLQTKGIIAVKGSSINILDTVLNSLFLILMIWVGITILLEAYRKQNGEEVQTRLSRWLQKRKIPPVLTFTNSRIEKMSIWIPLLCAVLVGIFTGLLGIGGGFIQTSRLP